MKGFKTLIFLFYLIASTAIGQTIAECKARYDKYLNLDGSLNKLVKFDADAIHILNAKGGKEFTIYAKETEVLSAFFENSSLEQQLKLYKEKGTKKLNQMQKDSLMLSYEEEKKLPEYKRGKLLAGIRIAIDPGHFSSNIVEAKIEGKYLYFPHLASKMTDSVKLVEGQLTFLTAKLLKNMLEEEGATVLLSRPEQNSTAFNISYAEWFANKRMKVLDSLAQIKEITNEQKLSYKKMPKDLLFWKFFRDYELVERANKINNFKPHLSVIIHYNVDEKNAPWKGPSQNNLTMAFIPGAFIADDIKKQQNKVHFVRLLLTKQTEESQNMGMHAVKAFVKNLKIPAAKITDTEYLITRGMSITDGVFSRNLILTRYINSPLIYGESLFQDNFNESIWLNSSDFGIYGLSLPKRIYIVSKSYYDAVMKYFTDQLM